MFLKLIAFHIKNSLQNLVKNTGFSFRLSKYDYDGSGCAKKYMLGGLLYISHILKKALNAFNGRFELDYVEIFITSRCTLNCRDCSVLVPHLEKLHDFDIETVVSDLRVFLGCVDYIHKLGILGGEALLHKDFINILEFAAKSEKIGSIRIVTNGTFIPKENVLNALKSTPKVYVNISKYPVVDKGKIQKLINILNENNIKFSAYEDLIWSDLGSPGMPVENDLKTLKKRYARCWMKKCLGILDGRFYMCGRSAFLPKTIEIKGGKDDYINLRDISDRDFGRTEIRQFLKKKSVAACAYCNGTFDSPKIHPAIQQNEKN